LRYRPGQFDYGSRSLRG